MVAIPPDPLPGSPEPTAEDVRVAIQADAEATQWCEAGHNNLIAQKLGYSKALVREAVRLIPSSHINRYEMGQIVPTEVQVGRDRGDGTIQRLDEFRKGREVEEKLLPATHCSHDSCEQCLMDGLHTIASCALFVGSETSGFIPTSTGTSDDGQMGRVR